MASKDLESSASPHSGDHQAVACEPRRNDRGVRLARGAVVVLAAVVYLNGPARPEGRFTQLAAAFLRGELVLVDPRPTINELIPESPLDPGAEDARRTFYCPYPPLPAILLMPFVAVWGDAARTDIACRLVSALCVLLFDLCLTQLTRPGSALIGPRDGGRYDQCTSFLRVALLVIFAFGSPVWHNASMGGDWHLAHAVALAAMLAALWEYLRRGRPAVVGLFVALAIASRPTTALTSVFFVLAYLRRGDARAMAGLARLAFFPAAAIFALAVYNHARFGSPGDFGYERMILTGEGAMLLAQYGQFNPRFIPVNLFWFFCAPPWPLASGAFPWLGYDPRGMSLFLAHPAMLLAIVGVARGWRATPMVRHALLGCVACLVPLLMHFNTGYWQYGHRFAMDYLAVGMVLVAAGAMAVRRGWLYALAIASVLISVVVVLSDPVVRIPIVMDI